VFEKMTESSGNAIGYKVVGAITKADYEQMMPEVEALVQNEGNIRLLLDMEEFRTEKAEAWGADLKFGRAYRKKIDKLAFIGNKKWEEWLAKLADPFYAREAKFFHTSDVDSAWAWLRE
jgi:hypothetical protein